MITRKFLFTLLAFSLTQTLPSAIASTSLTLNHPSKNFKLKSPDEFASFQGRLICGLDKYACEKPLVLTRARQKSPNNKFLLTRRTTDTFSFVGGVMKFKCDVCNTLCPMQEDDYTFRCGKELYNAHDICPQCLRACTQNNNYEVVEHGKIRISNTSPNKEIRDTKRVTLITTNKRDGDNNTLPSFSARARGISNNRDNNMLRLMMPNTGNVRSNNNMLSLTLPQNSSRYNPPASPQNNRGNEHANSGTNTNVSKTTLAAIVIISGIILLPTIYLATSKLSSKKERKKKSLKNRHNNQRHSHD